MLKRNRSFPIIAAAAVLFIWTASPLAARSPELLENVELKDCGACHASAVLPTDHPDMKNSDNGDCQQCHAPRSDNTLRGKITLSHTHLANEISCNDCHGDGRPFKAVGTETCRTCHGSPEGMEALTASLPVNPHTSPHYGNEMDCDMCHHVHHASENVCNECHEHTDQTP